MSLHRTWDGPRSDQRNSGRLRGNDVVRAGLEGLDPIVGWRRRYFNRLRDYGFRYPTPRATAVSACLWAVRHPRAFCLISVASGAMATVAVALAHLQAGSAPKVQPTAVVAPISPPPVDVGVTARRSSDIMNITISPHPWTHRARIKYVSPISFPNNCHLCTPCCHAEGLVKRRTKGPAIPA